MPQIFWVYVIFAVVSSYINVGFMYSYYQSGWTPAVRLITWKMDFWGAITLGIICGIISPVLSSVMIVTILDDGKHGHKIKYGPLV